MRSLIVSIIFALFLVSASALAQSDDYSWCQDEAKREIRELLLSDHSGILLKQFELSTLKLALVTSAPGYKTLEDYANNRAKELKDSAIISELESIYTTYGESETLQSALESLELANYWKSNLRMDNKDAALFSELHRMSSESSPFNRSDSAILWLFDKLSKSQGSTGSVEFNQTLSSLYIARILGAVGSARKVSYAELALQVEKVEGEFEQDFDSLLNSLSAEWKLRCQSVADLSCLARGGYQNAIVSLRRTPEWLVAIEKGIFKQDSAGELKFEFPRQDFNQDDFIEVDHHPDLAFGGLADLLIYDHHYLKYRDIAHYQKELNKLENAQIITQFHKDSKDKRDYAIVDKSNDRLYLMSSNGDVRATYPLAGSALGDVFEGGGAGVYHLEATGKSVMALSDERNRGKSIKLSAEAPKKDLESGSLIYILPTDASNIFKVKNGELNFTTTTRRGRYDPYNYSAKSIRPRVSAFYINDSSRRNSTSIRFVNALATQKARIMELYHLDNDEYNELAKLAYGILGNESDYGRSVKYYVK